MKILVVKLSSLGDILHALPAVHAIRAATGADVDWAVHPEFSALVRTFRDVRRVIEVPRHHLPRGLAASLRALRGERYDIAIDLQGLAKSAAVMLAVRAVRRIAPSYAREGSALLFRERAAPPSNPAPARHAVEKAFDTFRHLGLPIPPAPLAASDFDLPPVGRPQGSPLIAIAPVSRWATKNWPPAGFAAAAGLIAANLPDARFAVVGGRADIPAGDTITAALPARIDNLCGKTSVPETMALLAQCNLLVANDTGPVHMAAAVGTRCLVVFGATRPEWTGPWGDGHRVITASLPCQPCVKRRCRRGDLACLAAISPETVAAAAVEMLATAGPGAFRG